MFTTMRRALRENGVAAVSMAAISSALVLLGRMVTVMLSLEAKLMVVSLLWASMYLLQRVFVGKRRSSGHWFVQYTAMAAYHLPTPLVLYAANAISYSTSNINDSTRHLMVGVLGMFFATVLIPISSTGLAFTNMRAYSLCDRPRGRYDFLMSLVFLGLVEWEWARIQGSNSNLGGLERLVYPVQIFFVVFVILFANTSETSELDCQTKEVADYMKQESSKSSSTSPFFDDDDDDDANNNMQLLDCCRYPFLLLEDGKWVTIKDLVQRDDLRNEDRDIWLSYSLSRLLSRRYYGFHCAEEGDDTVRRFALADLGRTREDGYKRAFKTIEVQLAFLHDYFFTASLPIIQSGLGCIDAEQLLQLITFAMPIFFILYATATAIPGGERDDLLMNMVLSAFLCFFIRFWLYLIGIPMSFLVKNLLASYWRPIHTAFSKFSDLTDDGRLPTNFLERLFHLNPFQTQTDGVYWRNKIGQYSILQDYDRGCSPKKALVAWFNRAILSQPSHNFIKHLPVEEEEVDMKNMDSMRKLVAGTLQAIDGPPTSGTRSLKINMDEINRDEVSRDSASYDWFLTCKQETHTDTILTWHIATCYCDMSRRHSDRQEGFSRLAETDTFHKVAITLSRYCAYLVAFLPEFLPEHSLTTKQVFQRVIQEARGALGTTPMEENEKYTKMQELPLPHQSEQQTTFQKGVELGRQLVNLDTHLSWKVMAEFWAETILYIAPSDNAEAHIEHLAKGGEFITHLWAMLSNAGILKRAIGEWHPPHPPLPASPTTEGPPTDQLMEALSPSIDEASTSSSMSSPPTQTSEHPTN